MKLNFSNYFFVGVFLSFSTHATEIYSGEWVGENKVDGTQVSSFTLDIEQNGTSLEGQYCYISQGGNRIDCPDKDVKNLHGTVNESSAIIHFDSSFGGKNGQAVIKVSGSSMIWKLLKEPIDGNFYAPTDYKLLKDNSVEKQSGEKKVFTTDKFTVVLNNKCGPFFSTCEKMSYFGTRKKDGSTINLAGKTLSDNIDGKVKGAIFTKGNFIYNVYYEPPRLQVVQNGKIILDQPGKWEDK